MTKTSSKTTEAETGDGAEAAADAAVTQRVLDANQKGEFPAFFPTVEVAGTVNNSAMRRSTQRQADSFPVSFYDEGFHVQNSLPGSFYEGGLRFPGLPYSGPHDRSQPSLESNQLKREPGPGSEATASTANSSDKGSSSIADGETQNNNVAPPAPLARTSYVSGRSFPGAFHVRRREDTTDNAGTQPASQESIDLSIITQPVADAGGDTTSGLAVAQLLTDEDHHDPAELPQAEPAVQGGTKRVEQQAMEFKTKVFLGIVFVVSLIGILVGCLVRGKDKQIYVVATTIPPTMAPTSYQQAIQANVLSLFPPETVDATKDPDSPQSKALQWLLEDENLPHISDDRVKQRFALATFYFATNGQEWKNNQNWLNYSVHECEWYNGPEFALKSAFSTAHPGYMDEWPPPGPPPTICQNDTGLYENLWQAHNNLVGSLPLELYWLTSLHTLSMGINNGLDGSISSHVGHLTNLQGLDMTKIESHGLRSAGSIPSEIGLLTSLSILTLDGNNINGSVPTELWQLTNLSTVNLYRNPQLSFTIPTEIGTFPNLRWLITAVCNGSGGTIPTELGLIDTLEYVSMSEGSLTGTIPSEIGRLSKLSMLSLHSNQLEGTLPTELGLLTMINSLLSIRTNQLSGSIPSELGLLTSLAITLNLRENLLSGTIPTELGLFPVLIELSFSENQLTGTIPSEFGHLTMVGQLSLANNSLSGTIPQELSALQQSLHSLYLEGNPMLSGIIPEAVCAMNGTCVGHILDKCEPPFGLIVDCTSSFCGCTCSC